jgi:hypothetical protein
MAIKYIICIISTDEDPGLRIERFAVINLRGVYTFILRRKNNQKPQTENVYMLSSKIIYNENRPYIINTDLI